MEKNYFKNFDTYYKRYCNYIGTSAGYENINVGRQGFVSYESLIQNVYGKTYKESYYAKYLKEKGNDTNEKLCLSQYDISFYIKRIECNIEDISMLCRMPNGENTSFWDTVKKIGHPIFYNQMVFFFCDDFMIRMSKDTNEREFDGISFIGVYVINDIDVSEIEDFLNEFVVISKTMFSDEKRKIYIATSGSLGIATTAHDINCFNCNLDENYNDDLPYDKIKQLIESDKQELILLHGEPGTGKTSIIKKIINDYPDKEFVYMDFKIMTSFSDMSVFTFLTNHSNCVLIIEDCEKLFTDRNNGNQYLNTMLNLTDGIVGEVFGIKFICTFNCPPSKIDKAVMREGRLSLIYEFGKLSLEKTKKLMPNATEPMTLAQIYCDRDNGANGKEKKIGF